MSADNRTGVLILTAISEELDLDAILGRADRIHYQWRGAVSARVGSTDVVIAATGDGAKNAAERAAAFCESARPRAVVGAGIAGALSPGLGIGAIVAASRVRDSSGDAPAPDTRLLSRAVAAGASAGTLLTVGRPITAAAEKSRLAASLEGPSAVDMESAAWARVAAARGIPYCVVRSISDRADEDLPDYLAACIGEDGAIRRGAVVARALARPGRIPELIRMRRRVLDCGKGLSLFLERFLADGLP
jgi:adenosylhomocysteine nucleosidase